MSRWRAIAAAATAALASGCAVGYVAVRPEDARATASAADWSALPFAVVGAPSDRLVVARVLRGRYGVVDLRAGLDAAGAFTLAVARLAAPRASALQTASFMVSFFTFAVVPGWIDETHELELTLTAPGGAQLTATDRVTVTSVSWLPLLLFGPTLVASVNGGIVDADLAQLEAAETIVSRFVATAEPFVASHRGERGRAP